MSRYPVLIICIFLIGIQIQICNPINTNDPSVFPIHTPVSSTVVVPSTLKIMINEITIQALDSLYLNCKLTNESEPELNVEGANVSYRFRDLSGNLQYNITGNYTGYIDLEEYATRPGSYTLDLYANKTGYTSSSVSVPVEIIPRAIDLEILPSITALHPGDSVEFRVDIKDKLTGNPLLRPVDLIIKIYPAGGNPDLEAIVSNTSRSVTSLEFIDLIIPSNSDIGTYDILIQIESIFYTGRVTLENGLVIDTLSQFWIIAFIIAGICITAAGLYVQQRKARSQRSVGSSLLMRKEVFSNVIFYKFSKQGPTVVFSEHPLEEPLATSSGAYFYTAIGQGSQYRTGLFGPVPFGSEGDREVALIYATNIVDTGLIDQRLKRYNYILIALTFLPEKLPSIDRTRLEQQLAQLTKQIPDVSALENDRLTGIVAQIHAVL